MAQTNQKEIKMTTAAEDYENKTGNQPDFEHKGLMVHDATYVDWLEAERTKWKAEAERKSTAMLVEYSNWLCGHGYTDDDIWAENAVEQYLEENKE